MKQFADHIGTAPNRSVARSFSVSRQAGPAVGLQFKKSGKRKARKKDDPVITSPNGKRSLLISTKHGMAGEDLSGEVPEDMKKDASIVLEYPSLAGTGQDRFSDDAIGSILDDTQASLAGNIFPPEDNVDFIGADGRKAFQNDEIHAISIRHKRAVYDFTIKPDNIIPRNIFSSLANKYTSRCLGLKGGPPTSETTRLNSLIEYYDGTNLSFVMANTYTRMQEIANTLPLDRRKSIKRKVMAKLEQDMDKRIDSYRSDKEGYKKHNVLHDLIQRTNLELISVFYDSIANLLLYTEVLATDKPNVIVAYGGDHLPPLKNLLGETWATPKRKKRKKKR